MMNSPSEFLALLIFDFVTLADLQKLCPMDNRDKPLAMGNVRKEISLPLAHELLICLSVALVVAALAGWYPRAIEAGKRTGIASV